MKVALISHTFPPNMTGGIGTYTLSLAEALTKRGIDVTVFCGGRVKKELKCNFKIRRLPMLNFPPRAVWFQLQNYNYLKNELKNFDIIHSQMTTLSIFKYLRKEINKPWIVTFHDCPTEELKIFFDSPLYTKNFGDFIFNVLEYPLYKKLYDMDLKNADKLIFVSNSVLSDLKKHSKFDFNKVKVIQNGIDIKRIEKIIKNIKKVDNKKIRLIFFGRLFYRKGPTFLVEAMRQIVKYNKNIILDIYGEGPLKNTLKKQILKYNLENYIKLHNFLPNNKVIEEGYNSDVVVLPSLYEAFPITYLEAMTCFNPPVTFDCPFSRELIKNRRNGILVKPKDSKELANAILELIKNPKLREKLGKNAYKTVKEKHDWEKIVDEYIKVYKEILNHDPKI